MKLSMYTKSLSDAYGLKTAVRMIADAGFDAIDFSVFSEEFYTAAHDRTFYADIRRYTEDLGLYFNQAHAPYPSSYVDAGRTEETFGHIVQSMRNASWLGVRNIVVHPCQHLIYADEGNPERLFEINMDFYRRLLPYCEEFGIHVAVENMWQRPSVISHSTCSRPEEFLRYINALDSEWFVACLDIGHAMLVRETPHDMIRSLGGHLKALHVHDVDGFKDSHTLPFYGVVNWERAMQALAEIDYQGELTYEAGCFFNESPRALWPAALKFMEQTGRYLIERFDFYKNNR